MATRRGFGLWEIMTALVVTGAILTLVTQAALLSASHRSIARQETIALQEAANAVQRCSLVAFDALSPQMGDAIVLSPEAGKTLPQGKLAVSISEANGNPDAKRVAVLVSWGDPARLRKVRLFTWRFRTEDE